MRTFEKALHHAGLRVRNDGHLEKVDNRAANLGMSPELALARALLKLAPHGTAFRVKHYSGSEHPCLMGAGFDLDVAEPREEVEAFAEFLNTFARSPEERRKESQYRTNARRVRAALKDAMRYFDQVIVETGYQSEGERITHEKAQAALKATEDL